MKKNRKITILGANVSDVVLKNKFAAKSNYQFLYFGKDVENYYRLSSQLPLLKREFSVGELINCEARKIKNDFINFDKYLKICKQELFWYANSISEKNPYNSDLFYNCSSVIVLNKLIKNKSDDLLIVVEDFYFSLFLKQYLESQQNEIELFWYNRFNISLRPLTQISKMLENVLKIVFFRWKFVVDCLTKKSVLKKHHEKNADIIAKAGPPDILLTVMADGRTFKDKEQIDKEVYYGDLPKVLREQGKKIGYIILPIESNASYEEIVASTTKLKEFFVLPEQGIRFRDILWIITSTLFRSARLKEPFILEGFDFSELINIYLRCEPLNQWQFEKLKYYFVGRYLRTNHLCPVKVIHLYESQPWEKALRRGIYDHMEDTQVDVFQHVPFPPLAINYSISEKESHSPHVPQNVFTIGHDYVNIFRSEGYISESIHEGAAIRFVHLYSDSSLKDERKSKNIASEVKTALVALSISFPETFEMVCKVVEAFKEMPAYTILLKFHPKMENKEKLISSVLKCLKLSLLPDNFSIVDNPIEELLKKTSVLFYNFTAVSYEAIASNIPVVCIQSDIWFDMDKMEWFNTGAYHARTAKDIQTLMQKIETLSFYEWKEKCSQYSDIINKSFNNPNEKTLNKIAGML